ncbi:MAG: hypothetical protein ACYDEV_18275 [Acidiferrobacter sp.]
MLIHNCGGDEWLRMLMGSGGSRPKASLVDSNGHLWIAKFSCVRDSHDVGAWELVAHTLARGCGPRVPEGLARRFPPHVSREQKGRSAA